GRRGPEGGDQGEAQARAHRRALDGGHDRFFVGEQAHRLDIERIDALHALATTTARQSFPSSRSRRASARSRINSTLTWLFGGRLTSAIATWPSRTTETSPYWFFIR